MIRSVRLNEDDMRILQLASRYLGTLAAVERAHMLGSDEEVEAILGAVDPLDVRVVRGALEEYVALWHRSPIRIGAEPTASRDGSASPRADAASASSSWRSSAPSFHPESRRV
jgi:hypothetical protein